jgi:tRNA-uridine 2-sulfurtransferase
VVAKDIQKNTITVGGEDDLQLFRNTCTLSNWTGEVPELGKKYGAKVRHRQEDQEVMIERKGALYIIHFTNPQRAITPGQIAVIYDGDLVV